ncbi:MAG: glycosyltransferase, partial [Duncaniella sp.]|nr:glycosyltransferase [Duncaniella sp.]
VIPNAALPMPMLSDCGAKRVIAVGRLDYQKGFDRLVDVWDRVCRDRRADGWRLDIFGQGEWRTMLEHMIAERGLSERMAVNAPTCDIASEYANSSILAMTSHYEGFPMVMIEAMSAGLPVVTFDYKCGPRDIITSGKDGVIVADGDNDAFADALLMLMADADMRRAMGSNATEVTDRYSEDRVMGMWTDLFGEIVK